MEWTRETTEHSSRYTAVTDFGRYTILRDNRSRKFSTVFCKPDEDYGSTIGWSGTLKQQKHHVERHHRNLTQTLLTD